MTLQTQLQRNQKSYRRNKRSNSFPAVSLNGYARSSCPIPLRVIHGIGPMRKSSPTVMRCENRAALETILKVAACVPLVQLPGTAKASVHMS